MEHNPISMGDIAYGMASDEQYRRKALEKRVSTLENQLEDTRRFVDYLVSIINSMLEEQYGLAEIPERIVDAIRMSL